mmetsp:Transcript_12804/g.14693  ORF Transcript_12804/g.14693 Transcript_12804/m.14693 type:complete len:132 (-) Transcript_12804:920-1315(-)
MRNPRTKAYLPNEHRVFLLFSLGAHTYTPRFRTNKPPFPTHTSARIVQVSFQSLFCSVCAVNVFLRTRCTTRTRNLLTIGNQSNEEQTVGATVGGDQLTNLLGHVTRQSIVVKFQFHRSGQRPERVGDGTG